MLDTVLHLIRYVAKNKYYRVQLNHHTKCIHTHKTFAACYAIQSVNGNFVFNQHTYT